MLLAAGANVNAKAPDGSTALHQAVQARKPELIRTLVGAGAKFDEKNRDSLTPLELAEKPEGAARGDAQDPNLVREKRATRQEVIVLMRELMGLPPADAETLAGTKKVEPKKDEKPAAAAPAAAAAN